MKKKTLVILVCLTFIGFQVHSALRDAGVYRSLHAKAWGQCEALAGPEGAEDLTIDFQEGIAYMVSDQRRPYLIHGDQSSVPNGGLWSLNLNKQDSRPVQIELDIDGIFHPHGLSFWRSESEEKFLYVINHIDSEKHEVLVFELSSPIKAEFRKKYSFPEMISPNDLVVFGKDKFFFTNDHGSPRHTFMEVLEDYLGLPRANVIYFDGVKPTKVISGLRMANGIQLSPDHKELYIAETTAQKVARYKQVNGRDWERTDEIKVDSGVDNLEWDRDGSLLLGAHPKLFDFLAYMNDESKLSSSEIIRIDVSEPVMQRETIYLDDGHEISGSSVAVIWQDIMVVGSVFDAFLLKCVK